MANRFSKSQYCRTPNKMESTDPNEPPVKRQRFLADSDDTADPKMYAVL
jgi:hypothetical protein